MEKENKTTKQISEREAELIQALQELDKLITKIIYLSENKEEKDKSA